MEMTITLSELEQAINYWRQRLPSNEQEWRLCPQAAALAAPYAWMIIEHRHQIALAKLDISGRAAYEQWHATLSATCTDVSSATS
jgi:hypothetical protein